MSLMYPIFLLFSVPVIAVFLTKEKKNIAFHTHILILLLIIIALTQPILKKGISKGTVEARDIVIAVDISHSMDAKDVMPSRYAYGKEVITHFLKSDQRNNIALFAFTTNALLLSPPTTDHRLVETALKSIHREYILTRGTSLEALFLKVGELKMNKKPLLLLTDGGEEQEINKLIRIVNEKNIHLIVLALGTETGTTITTPNGEALKDNAHNLVVSRINPLLKRLVSQTDGTYLKASPSTEKTASILQKRVNDYFSKEEAETKYTHKKEYRYLHLYQIPLLLATLLFFMLHTVAIRYLFILFALFGIEANASSFSDLYQLDRAYNHYHAKEYNKSIRALNHISQPSLQSVIALGNSYYKIEAFNKALSVYLSIRSQSKTIKKNIFYNIANCYAKLEKYDKAALYYNQSLQLGFDEETKSNLALIMRLKKRVEGMTLEKTDSAGSAKGNKQEQNKKDQGKASSSSASSGGSASKTKHKVSKKAFSPKAKERHPLGSKVYELINKGYINETKPW